MSIARTQAGDRIVYSRVRFACVYDHKCGGLRLIFVRERSSTLFVEAGPVSQTQSSLIILAGSLALGDLWSPLP